MTLTKIELYTDGACSGNPGPGGWGTLLRHGATEKELSGGERDTTNNRMELMAVIKGLEALKKRCHVEIYSDSKYVIDGATSWLEGWKKRGWKNAAKEPVKNSTLWKQLDELLQQHQVVFHWVKGHAGHVENERVDALARSEIEKMREAGII